MTQPTDPAAQSRLTFGRTVRELRACRGWTVRHLAELLQVSPATVSAIENGRTGISAARTARLAEVLDVPVQRIFSPSVDGRRAARPARPARTGAPGLPLDSHDPRPLTADADWRYFPPLSLDTPLNGALSSFLEFGYHGATIRTIAERAQLSVAGVYHYYASKQDMLVALLDLTMTDLHTRTLAARDEGRDPVERFALLVECLALVHTHRRELAFVGASEMRSLAPDARRRVASMRSEEQRIVDHEVEQAVRTGAFQTTRPHEAARAVVTMCTALPQWFRDTGPASAEQVAAQYVEFALDLVRCVAERPNPQG
jgi:AcrR family transcriptional regulator/transcriptional regulator with XRE-family HTH domain